MSHETGLLLFALLAVTASQSFPLTVSQTLKTWTLLKTCIGAVALGLSLLLALFL
jgi:H+/gluconate symporter-like permease